MFFTVLAFSGFLTAYRKNKIFAAIILIILFLTSQMNVLNLLTTLPLIAATVVTFCFLIYETINEYNEKNNKEFIISSIILLLGFGLILLIINHLVNLNLIKFFTTINWLKFYGLILSFLLCFIQYNKQSNQNYPLETNHNISKNDNFEHSNNYRDSNTKFKFNKVYFIIILIFGFSIGIGSKILNTTVIDLEKVVQLKYNTNKYITDVGYYTPWEHYDEDNFYTELYSQAEKLGYTKSQVQAIIPTYSRKVQNKLKAADLQVKLDHNDDITFNEQVEFDIKFDEEYAQKNNLKFKNTHFTKKAKYLKQSLAKNDLSNATLNFNEIEQHLKQQLTADQVEFTNLSLQDQDLIIDEKSKYNISFLELHYQLDGKQNKIFNQETINNLVYRIEIYQQNNNVKLNFENSNITYQ